jgi:hypothetical protein
VCGVAGTLAAGCADAKKKDKEPKRAVRSDLKYVKCQAGTERTVRQPRPAATHSTACAGAKRHRRHPAPQPHALHVIHDAVAQHTAGRLRPGAKIMKAHHQVLGWHLTEHATV